MILYCFLNVGETPERPLSALIDLLGGDEFGGGGLREGSERAPRGSFTHSLTHSLTYSECILVVAF